MATDVRNMRLAMTSTGTSLGSGGPGLQMGVYAAAFLAGALLWTALNWNYHHLPPPKQATAADLLKSEGLPPPSTGEQRAMDAVKVAGSNLSSAGRASLINACGESARQRAIEAAHGFAVASGQSIAISLRQRGPAVAFGNITIGLGDSVYDPDGKFDPRRERDGEATLRALIELGQVSTGEVARGNRDAQFYLSRTFGPAQRTSVSGGAVTPYCQASQSPNGPRRTCAFC